MKRLFSSNTISQKLRESKYINTAESDDIEMTHSSLGRTRRVLTQVLNKTKGGIDEEEVGIMHLINYLVVDMEKRMHLRQMIPYMVFLCVLTALVVTEISFSEYSDPLQQTEEVTNILLRKQLSQVGSKDQMWNWIRDATKSTYESGPSRICSDTAQCSSDSVGSQTFPISVLMLRQWRVPVYICGNVNGITAKAITPCDISILPCNCTHKYSASESSTETYGIGDMTFVSDSALKLPFHPLDLTTQHITYRTENQFSLIFPLSDSLDSIISNLTVHEEQYWVDEQTRVVSLETLFYNPDSEQFVRTSCFAEFFQTGLGMSNCFYQPPYKLEVFDGSTTRTALSLIVMFYIIPFLYWLGQSVYFRAVLKKDFIVVGEIYQIIHVVVLSIFTYYQGLMWDLSSVMSSGRFYEEYLTDDFKRVGDDETAEGLLMFHYSSRYAFYGRRYHELLGILLVVSWLRIFKFLQHFHQLNMLSETTRIAAIDVFRLATIFMYCVLAFSMAGSLVFSSQLREFETPSHAGSTLLRMFFMEHEPDYIRMRDMQPFWAPVYVVSFFLLCYFMLLNMVLAVIVSSFTQVQSAQETAKRQLAVREDQILDEEILILRNRSNSVALAGASRPSRFSRTQKKFVKMFASIKDTALHWLTADNSQREKAVQLAKEHCARDLRIPRYVLKEHPEYYNRVSITKEELKRVFAKLLSDADLENIFMGVQKKVFTQENTHVLIVQAMSELAADIQRKFEEQDMVNKTAFDDMLKKMNGMQNASGGGEYDIMVTGPSGNTKPAATILQLRQQLKEALAENKRLTKSQAKAQQALAQATVQQQLADLNSEREFLVDQLAVSEKASIASMERRASTDGVETPLQAARNILRIPV